MNNFKIGQSDNADFDTTLEIDADGSDAQATGALLAITVGTQYEYGVIDLTLDQADALAKELTRRVTDERVRRAELERNKTP